LPPSAIPPRNAARIRDVGHGPLLQLREPLSAIGLSMLYSELHAQASAALDLLRAKVGSPYRFGGIPVGAKRIYVMLRAKET
jgi:hypothetical protein